MHSFQPLVFHFAVNFCAYVVMNVDLGQMFLEQMLDFEFLNSEIPSLF
jgi:hypothetical protein